MTDLDPASKDDIPARDEWIERHVERNVHHVHMARLDAYIAGDGSGGERCAPEVVREDLRAMFRNQLQQPVSDTNKAFLTSYRKTIQGDRFVEIKSNRLNCGTTEEQEAYEARRDQAMEDWNKRWREATGVWERDLPPSLSGVSLQGLDLRGIHLNNADLRQRPDLGSFGSKHDFANLSGAWLGHANFSGNSFVHTRLDEARMENAYLVGARLNEAKLRGADLQNADLRNADLTDADLTGANLRHADLTGAKLLHAILDGADLRFAKGLRVDENSAHRTRFTNRASLTWRMLRAVNWCVEWLSIKLHLNPPWDRTPKLAWEDDWSELRRTYTGPSFFISLLFLVAFTVPYIAKGVILSEVSSAEAAAVQAISRLIGQDIAAMPPSQAGLETLETQLPLEYGKLRDEYERLVRTVEETAAKAAALPALTAPATLIDLKQSIALIADQVRTMTDHVKSVRAEISQWTAASISERRYPIWQILLGVDTGNFAWTALIVLLVLYNGLRWLLTTNIAPMRDVEDRSYVTPALIEYRLWLPLHRAMNWLYWISLAVGLYTFAIWMSLPVYKFW